MLHFLAFLRHHLWQTRDHWCVAVPRMSDLAYGKRRWSQKVDHLNARQVITCRPHSNFHHQVMCRRVRSSNRPPGETVVQRREVSNAVQDRVHHTTAKDKGDRLFMSHIRPHVETSANFNRFQSAYRRAHSTETTLLRMLNDVYDTADNQSRSCLLTYLIILQHFFHS